MTEGFDSFLEHTEEFRRVFDDAVFSAEDILEERLSAFDSVEVLAVWD